MFQNTNTLAFDNLLEDNFRIWTGQLRAALLAAGLVKVYSNLIPENLPIMRATMQDTTGIYPANNLYDGVTTTEFRTSALPTVGAPAQIIYDSGNGNTFSCASMQVYTSTSANDGSALTVDRSDDGATWTNEPVSLSTLASSTGYQNVNITTPSAHRYWRMSFTSIQGGTGYLRVVEWRLWTAAGGTGTMAVPYALRPVTASTAMITEVWRLADTLQSTAPFFMKIEMGSNTPVQNPALWITFGTVHDGSGGLTGTQVTTRNVLLTSASNFSAFATVKGAFTGDVNRFSAVLFANQASQPLWFHFERMSDATGADVNTGLMWFLGSNTVKYQGVLPTSGAVPTQEADFGLLPPLSGVTLRGNNRRPVKFTPFLNGEELPARHIFGYMSAEYTGDALQPNVTIYGTARQYYAVGQNLTFLSTRAATLRLAIRGE